MTRFLSSISLLALALAAAPVTASAQSAQSAQDFQLPPNPAPTATPTPTVQGPVDFESGAPVRPRPIPTPVPTVTPVPTPNPVRSAVATPTPSAVPRPRPQATPTVTLPGNREAPAAPASLALPRPTATVSSESETTRAQAGAVNETTPSTDAQPAPVGALPSPSSPDVVTPESDSIPAWWWLAGLGALALMAIGAARALRRSRAAPLRIEPPVVRKERVSTVVAPRAALTLRPEAIRLSRSVMAATLSYRLTVLNRGTEALNNVVIEADLASASGNRPVEEQVAMATTALEPRHTMPRLAPGQSARFEGRLQLQLNQAGILRQGNTPLLVPLLRLRTTAEGIEPQAQTLVIGQQGTGGSSRLQPIRLDEGPRGYEPLAQRALD